MLSASPPNTRRGPSSSFLRRQPSAPLDTDASGNLSLGGSTTTDPTNAMSTAAYWSARSVYVPPLPPSGSHCVLQNDLLCSFGGLQHECDGLLYQVVPRDVALQPSNHAVYIRSCSKIGVTPLPRVVSQLSTTPGRYTMMLLDVSGTPLTAHAMAALLPLISVNRETLLAMNLRSCSLHEGAWEVLCTFFMERPVALPRLKSIELSCNLLSDADGKKVIAVVEHCPKLQRIGILKNCMSKSTAALISAALHERNAAWRLLTRTPEPQCGVATNSDFFTPRPSSRSPQSSGFRRSPVSEARETRTAYATLPIPPPPTSAGGHSLRLPRISRDDFFRAVTMYRRLMTKQTAILDTATLQTAQPAIFEVFRRQTNAIVDSVTLPRYLCACFPHLSPVHVMAALAYYSEFSLTAPVRKVTHEGLRPDQRLEILKIFKCLDKDNSGVLPTRILTSPRASEAEVLETDAMLQRLHIQELNFDAFASIVAPYLAEAKRKRRLR